MPLIQSPLKQAYVCIDCVEQIYEFAQKERKRPSRRLRSWQMPQTSPAQIKAHLDQYIVGQESAKRKVAIAVYNHYLRIQALLRHKDNP
ncbi:MAG: hypothetical protein NZ580_07710, partial [Bacteroidia bacterium]|nr:hypothetical protein [Bacteroidia bacterium]